MVAPVTCLGNCLDLLRGVQDNTFTAVVTDPPYALTSTLADVPACDSCGRQCNPQSGIKVGDPCPRCGKALGTRRTLIGPGFMGKSWDNGLIAFSPEVWKEILRVCKPGAHLLAFGGTRTYHRIACAIEDAGWEIRECVMWVHAQGFPKSLDVSKAIDKAAGAERTEIIGSKLGRPGMAKDGSNQSFDSSVNTYGSGGILSTDITAPATDAAKTWNGYGTAAKPAYEPVILARKPLDGTVAENVQKWGCGALNIDGCRVEYISEADRASATPQGACTSKNSGSIGAEPDSGRNESRVLFDRPEQNGRWPANILHDGSEEVLELFPRSKSCNTPSSAKPESKYRPGQGSYQPQGKIYPGDDGSAARFFYCAKSAKGERNAGCQDLYWKKVDDSFLQISKEEWETLPANEKAQGNIHPTVKPLSLMRYLLKLVTMPEQNLILDPFMGSGTTLVAAVENGVLAVGIDFELPSKIIADHRIQHAIQKAEQCSQCTSPVTNTSEKPANEKAQETS